MMQDKPLDCLVIMPYGKGSGRYTYDSIYENVIEPAVKQAFKDGATCVRIKDEHLQGELRPSILKRLEDADIVIADLTANNPNVLFELGYRWAQGKTVVILTRDSDLKGFWPQT